MDQSFVSPYTMADGCSVFSLSLKGSSWEMKPSGSITCHLSHDSCLGLGVGKRNALPGSATFRLQSHLPWESVAGLLWIMMCRNAGFYFCRSSAGYKSWCQAPWAQQKDINGKSMHNLLLLSPPPFTVSYLLFFPFFLSTLIFMTLFPHIPPIHRVSPEPVRDSSSEERELWSPSAILL